jgi:hypothetical protein
MVICFLHNNNKIIRENINLLKPKIMIKYNVKEYEIIRNEMQNIKSCITSYLSLIIGTSGISIFAVSYIEIRKEPIEIITIIYFFVAILLTAIYYVLIYKFISHNRYAGYLRLISQEVKFGLLHPENETNNANSKQNFIDKDILVWELCMCKLNNAKPIDDFPIELWQDKLFFNFNSHGKPIPFQNEPNIWSAKNILIKVWNKLKISGPEIDHLSIWEGIFLLIRGIFNKEISRSWKYPLYVTYMVLVFNLMFLSLFIYYNTDEKGFLTTVGLTSKVVIVSLIAIYILLWYGCIKELHKIMLGSKTINSFCWKFLQFRIEALNQFGYIPYYEISEGKIEKYEKNTLKYIIHNIPEILRFYRRKFRKIFK